MSIALDPGKAGFYGQFIAAAYDMYAVDNDDLRPAPKNIPAGWELSAWINMSDFLFDIKAPKFYGIVVHETANPDNRIIPIRGTEGIVEWLVQCLGGAAFDLLQPLRPILGFARHLHRGVDVVEPNAARPAESTCLNAP
jgi:hypothetical protein